MELHTTSSSMCNYELMTSHRSVIDISHGHQSWTSRRHRQRTIPHKISDHMTWNHRQPTKPHQLMHRCVLLLLSAVYMLCVCMLSENIFRKWCSLDHRRGSQPTDSKCWLDKSGQQWMDTNHDEQHQHSPWLRKVINGFTSLQSTDTAGKIRNSLIAVEWYVIAVSWLCSRYYNTNNYIETYSLINAWYVDVDARTQCNCSQNADWGSWADCGTPCTPPLIVVVGHYAQSAAAGGAKT